MHLLTPLPLIPGHPERSLCLLGGWGNGDNETTLETHFMKLTKKQKQNFARRFSMEDWGILCSNAEFLTAFESGDLALSEVVAHRLLTRPE